MLSSLWAGLQLSVTSLWLFWVPQWQTRLRTKSNKAWWDSSNLFATCFRPNSITLSRSQTWSQFHKPGFQPPTCHRQVQAERPAACTAKWNWAFTCRNLDSQNQNSRNWDRDSMLNLNPKPNPVIITYNPIPNPNRFWLPIFTVQISSGYLFEHINVKKLLKTKGHLDTPKDFLASLHMKVVIILHAPLMT